MGTVSSTIALVDQMSGALANIESNINSMKSTLQSLSGEQTAIDKFDWGTFLKNAEKAGQKMEKIGKKMAISMTTPLILLGKKLYGTATEYESAFAGVKKTTDATEAEYEQLYGQLLEIAETNPTGFVEAAGIMEMAGQLGVAKEELAGFTQAYIGLQESTNIGGEDGAADLARFLNVTEKSTANIERVGGVIVGLGNNFATTEAEILAMATRMGATADLAGFSSAEILAFSAALSSVGINAEAGGSAAGKLMKKMQLAAEVGGKAQEAISGIHWTETDKKTGVSTEVWLKDLATSGLEFVNYLDTLKSAEKVDIASQLGMTVESLQNMADSWLLFDQFSEVMGITGEDFLKGWDESPAQSMLKFFQGLGNLDPEAGNSVLAQLAEMDITEIRLSNLVAALAGNSEVFQAALAEAYKQYGLDTESNAMAEEVAKRYETQESQNAMLGNKLENSMADLGDNLVKALQPALDMVNNLLDAFNNLSEVDQTNIIKGLMIIAALGPALSIAGAAIKAIAAAMQLISGSGKGAADAVKGVIDAANTGNTASQAIEGGLSTSAKLVGGLTLAGVTYLFAKGIEYRNTHGALGSIEAVTNAIKDNEALRDAFLEYVASNNELENASNDATISDEKITEIANRQQQAAEKFLAMQESSDLLHLYNDWRDTNGLSRLDWLLPEDFLNLFQTPETETPEIEIPEPEIKVPEAETPQIEIPEPDITIPEFDLPEVELPEVELPEITLPGTDTPVINLPEVDVSGSNDLGMVVGAGFGIGFTQGIETSGEEAVVAADNMTKGAVKSAKDAISSADNFSLGSEFAADLGSGIDGSASIPVASISALAAAVMGALQGVLSAGSGSAIGIGFGNGIAVGILASNGMVVSAAASVSNAAVGAAKGILSSGAGSAIGRAFGAGLAAGIRASTGAVVAAASAMAAAAKAAAASVLSIHSPSKVMYWQGEMTALGFANGIKDSQTNVITTVRSIFDDVKTTWNEGVWDLIGTFAETEAKAWQDEMNDVEDKVKISDSDIKKIRTLAEREVINQFTTAEVKVEMNNTNNINSDMDIDGVIARLEDRVAERLEAVAEGVYT